MRTVDGRKLNNKGFTLVELIVVMAIMVVLVGGALIGIGIISSGNAKKATKTLEASLNNLRINTMSMQGDWKLKVYMDGSQYKADIIKTITNEDKTTSSTVVSSEKLGSRISIKFIDGAETVVDKDESIYVTFKEGSGKVGDVTAGNDSGSTSIKGSESLLGLFKLQSDSGTTQYGLKLWYETGRITAE